MAVIHYLNVKQGDCSVIAHNSGRVTVIDVCNAKADTPESRLTEALAKAATLGVPGNFQQKRHPVNPVLYLKDHGISSVFRFILTHPDMDHLDGVCAFFEEFQPTNFWDTNNTCEKQDFADASPYDEEDWQFYKKIRNAKPQSDPKRLALYSGAVGKYYNQDEDGRSGGDGLHILAPTPELVKESNEADDFNDCSYVILYKTAGRRILFGGDSHDRTWEHVLSAHKKDVTNIDLLIAPHHGRKSDRSYDFLDVVSPKLTFFGNANSEHLAYGAWNYRELPFITNNQAGSMVVSVEGETMDLYATNKSFAEAINKDTQFSKRFKAYHICPFD